MSVRGKKAAQITVQITQLRDVTAVKREKSIESNYELSVEEFEEMYGNMRFRDGEWGIWCSSHKVGMGPSISENFEDASELKAAIAESPDDFVVAWFNPQREDHTEEVIRLVYLG